MYCVPELDPVLNPHLCQIGDDLQRAWAEEAEVDKGTLMDKRGVV